MAAGTGAPQLSWEHYFVTGRLRMVSSRHAAWDHLGVSY